MSQRKYVFIVLLIVMCTQSTSWAARPAGNGFRTLLLGRDSTACDSTAGMRRMPGTAGSFFFSLAVPGMGQWYAGNRKSAKIFLAAEAVLWAAYGGFRFYGVEKRSDYQAWASSHAGVSATGMDHDYYVAMENYMSLRDYNEEQLRQRNLSGMYPEDDIYWWQWDTEENRREFKSMRLASDRALNRAVIVIGGVVVNHLISAIDGLREAKKRSGISTVGVAGMPEGGGIVYVSVPL